MFAAYTEDYGQAVGYGGRYDDIGDAFGSLRPATGFSVDLKVLHKLGTHKVLPESSGIIAPSTDSESLWNFIQQLRQSEKVVQLLPGQSATELADRCDRQIVAGDGPEEWRLLPLAAM
jgi:ATP phosphoribosyltransferase regulatory subunit